MVVYDLSLLASLPNSLVPLLPPTGIPSLRPRPLFNVGIHDIPYLSSFTGVPANAQPDASWIACSTDTVLTMKSELFDVLVTLPPPYSKDAAEKVFPKISILPTPTAKHNTPQAVQLKATQRDARRYATLRKGLRQVASSDDGQPGEENDSDAASTYSSSPIVEPISWTRLAYTSFIWWASAGEKRDGLSEEEEEEHQILQDTQLLASVEHPNSPPSGSVGRRSLQPSDTSHEPPEIAIVAYFRRMTTQIFITLSDAIARHDSQDAPNEEVEPNDDDNIPYEDDPGDDLEPPVTIGRQSTQEDDRSPLLQEEGCSSPRSDDEPIKITTEDMTEMGLDVWSAADRIFVEELVWCWWNRKAYVDSARIRCCGVSIL